MKADRFPSYRGRYAASPRSSKSIDLPRSAGLCWIVVLGSSPFASPGTKTWSNSSPLATWIVITLTESSSEGWTGDHSCLSRFSTASTYSRNARSVSSPWIGEKECLVEERGAVAPRRRRRGDVQVRVELREDRCAG